MYWKYFKYVLRHKWFVFIECCKLGIPLRGALHDLSKFLPSEFISYSRYFYGDYPERLTVYEKTHHWTLKTKAIIKNDFDLAWLKHQKRNPHHWQYWLLQNDSDGLKILEMPKKYMKEMLADWIGAGKAIHGENDVEEWYLKNKDNMLLHNSVRHWVEGKLFKGESEQCKNCSDNPNNGGIGCMYDCKN